MLIFLQTIQEEERTRVEMIYRDYSGTMLHTAQSILKDSYLAEDAVSRAFLLIINNLQKIHFLNCNKTRGLVVIIVRNICYNMIKNEKSKATEPLEEYEDIPGKTEEIPLEHIVTGESYEFIMDCLSELHSNYKDILRLKLVYDYSDEEIAKILDVSQDNVRVRLHRARKALTDQMKKRGEGDE